MRKLFYLLIAGCLIGLATWNVVAATYYNSDTYYKSGSSCVTPTDVPQAEADALCDLYDATAGDSWTDNTNWKTDSTVGNWYGIEVSGGHVTRVELESNNLNGDAGATLDPLASNLDRLKLYSNVNLTAIDTTNLVNLTYLMIYSTDIDTTNLDVSGMNSMSILWLHQNLFTEAEVDTILCDADTSGMTNATIKLDGNNAPPSATGETCKTSLEGKGCTVTVSS